MRLPSEVYRFADNLPLGIVIFSPDGGAVYTNAAARSLLGNNDTVAIALDSFVQENGTSLSPAEHPVAKALRTKCPVPETILGIRTSRSMEILWLGVAANPIPTDTDSTTKCLENAIIVTLRDATNEHAIRTEMARRDKMLCDMEMTDELTGLPSRRFARYRLLREMEQASKHGYPLTVGLLDLDRFKHVNEAHGRSCGDNVLYHVATLLDQHIGESGVPARFGGEEFLVMFPKKSQEEAYTILEQFRETLSSATVDCLTSPVSVSGGITTASATDSRKGLLERLDALIYLAKLDGRNRILRDELYC